MTWSILIWCKHVSLHLIRTADLQSCNTPTDWWNHHVIYQRWRSIADSVQRLCLFFSCFYLSSSLILTCSCWKQKKWEDKVFSGASLFIWCFGLSWIHWIFHGPFKEVRYFLFSTTHAIMFSFLRVLKTKSPSQNSSVCSVWELSFSLFKWQNFTFDWFWNPCETKWN